MILRKTGSYAVFAAVVLALFPGYVAFRCPNDRAVTKSMRSSSLAAAIGRRESLPMIIGGALVVAPSLTWAQGETLAESAILKIRVSLASDAFLPSTTTTTATPALYITCRPDKPDNIPAAILNGSRGKPPPVLSARIPQPTFPTTLDLSIPRDLTLEGAWDGISSPTSISPPMQPDQLWWKDMDLIVSARWDSDGVAATRSPEDLVGRTIWKGGADGIAELELGGRGAFGKFATSKQ